jgi:hypothetical protein
MQVIGLAAAASIFWTANYPFVGKWRLDVSRSRIVDDMRIEALGSNKYAFNFEGGPRETVVADGTDQPGLPGTTLAVKAEDARTLTVVRKQNGHVIVRRTGSSRPMAEPCATPSPACTLTARRRRRIISTGSWPEPRVLRATGKAPPSQSA